MKLSRFKHPAMWGIFSAVATLLIGAATVILADFGMTGWFFVVSQVWLWTLGLPTTLGVVAVVALWGIPRWTTLPLWSFAICAAVIGTASQCAAFILLQRIMRRLAGARE